MANKNKTTLYIGVTNDLIARVEEHKNFIDRKSFAARYNLVNLVYFEFYSPIEKAIGREKQLKGWSRAKKNALINRINPKWEDLNPQDGMEEEDFF